MLLTIFLNLIAGYPFKHLFAMSGTKVETEESILSEAFADRRYTPALSLVSRTNENAVIQNLDRFKGQNIKLIRHGMIQCIDQIDRPMLFDTLCLHGDHPMALKYAKCIKEIINE